MREMRCIKCGRLLAKIEYGEGQIKCSRCKTLNTFHKKPYQDRLNLTKKDSH